MKLGPPAWLGVPPPTLEAGAMVDGQHPTQDEENCHHQLRFPFLGMNTRIVNVAQAIVWLLVETSNLTLEAACGLVVVRHLHR